MNAIVGHANKDTERETTVKPDAKLFGMPLGTGIETVFAIGVMLSALWLLLSGYV
jgi:hypothetical protein